MNHLDALHRLGQIGTDTSMITRGLYALGVSAGRAGENFKAAMHQIHDATHEQEDDQ